MSFHRRKERLVCKARDGRNERIRDAYTIGAIGASPLQAFDRLPKSPPKADGNDQVILVAVACRIRRLSGGRGGNYGKAQQGEPVVKKFHKADRQIATQQEDMSGFMNPLHQGGHTFHVEGIAKRVKVPQVLFQGLVPVRVQAGIVAGMSLHALQRGCVGNRKVMQVRLEFPVTAKPQTLDNAQNRGRVRPELARNVPNAQEDIIAWAFLDWANQFPSFLAQSGNPLRKTKSVVPGIDSRSTVFHGCRNTSDATNVTGCARLDRVAV